jgi:hypothetical protein
MKQWIVKYSTYRSRIASQTAPCSQVSKYFSFHYSSNKIKSLNIHAEHSNALLRPRTVGFARASSGLWVIREAVSSYVLNSTPAPTPYSLPSRVATTKTFAQPLETKKMCTQIIIYNLVFKPYIICNLFKLTFLEK